MTVTAEIGGNRIELINTIASANDIHRANSYGGLPSLLDRYKTVAKYKVVVVIFLQLIFSRLNVENLVVFSGF